MVKVKIKYLPLLHSTDECILCYQIYCGHSSFCFKTDYRFSSKYLANDVDHRGSNKSFMLLKDKIEWDKKCIDIIVNRYENKRQIYTAKDVVESLRNNSGMFSLVGYMNSIIGNFNTLGRLRTAETYLSALRSFMRFRNGKDLLLNEMDSVMVLEYESYLKKSGLVRNTSSFYMRILRAVYNRAVAEGFAFHPSPFKYVYTGVDKTAKRAVSAQVIRSIKNIDLTACPDMDFARDLFMFSFYTRGMSFIDIAFLKRKNIKNGVIVYKRAKTGQKLAVKIESCIEKILNKYSCGNSDYLFPIIRERGNDEYRQYRGSMCRVNYRLRNLGKILGLGMPLTMYVARHSWASIAKKSKIPISIISEGMGHDSELTTRVYLASLDASDIDNANSLILNLI